MIQIGVILRGDRLGMKVAGATETAIHQRQQAGGWGQEGGEGVGDWGGTEREKGGRGCHRIGASDLSEGSWPKKRCYTEIEPPSPPWNTIGANASP